MPTLYDFIIILRFQFLVVLYCGSGFLLFSSATALNSFRFGNQTQKPTSITQIPYVRIGVLSLFIFPFLLLWVIWSWQNDDVALHNTNEKSCSQHQTDWCIHQIEQTKHSCIVYSASLHRRRRRRKFTWSASSLHIHYIKLQKFLLSFTRRSFENTRNLLHYKQQESNTVTSTATKKLFPSVFRQKK